MDIIKIRELTEEGEEEYTTDLNEDSKVDFKLILKIAKKQKCITTFQDLKCFDYKKNHIFENGKQKWLEGTYKLHSSRKYNAIHREEINFKYREYYKIHNDVKHKQRKAKEFQIRYQKNKGLYKARSRNYRKENIEMIRERERNYYKANREKLLKRVKDYRKTEKGKTSQRKNDAKRRKFGFDIIAKFNSCKILSPTVYHHLNNNDVIEVSQWLHIKVSNPNVELHRKKVLRLIFPFLNSKYYNIIDFEKFEEYAKRSD